MKELGLLLILAITSEAYGMAYKRVGSSSRKGSAPSAPAPKNFPAPAPVVSAPAPVVSAPAPLRNPANLDPRGPEDRGIRDMGCNDRDRLDPNKPCKNVGSPIAAPNAQPIIIPVSPILVSPKYGNDEPEEASSSGANGASCDRLFPELSKVRAKRGSANSARFEYVRLRDQFLALSDADLLKSLMNGGIGKCYLSNGCPSCACSFYLKTSAADWAGLGGWPLNPKSRGSTGCVSTHQWGGYLPSMATDDLMQNAAMQARHALCHPADPCRIHPEHHNVPIHTDDVLDQ